ncbi:MAG TPA: hypothetical protein PKV82_13430, partial [Anaerolineae bacterium]|nr:hypothetical protein [Anaerolineae bacterium]
VVLPTPPFCDATAMILAMQTLHYDAYISRCSSSRTIGRVKLRDAAANAHIPKSMFHQEHRLPMHNEKEFEVIVRSGQIFSSVSSGLTLISHLLHDLLLKASSTNLLSRPRIRVRLQTLPLLPYPTA